MEASAFPASVGLARSRITLGVSLLRIRSDEQLVTLFRQGNDEAFRVIHDRYRARMHAYARQMLVSTGQDPEDAVQEIFMRAYYGLRASHRRLALRAWLYRIAHNRCIDDLRRPQPVLVGIAEPAGGLAQDPIAKVEQRDVLRRLISDVQRLPEQQRSALLMRELSGMSYSEVSDVLGVSVGAVKSLLVRARVSLAQATEARDTTCAEIRDDVILSHDRGVRTSGLARRHMRDCPDCRQFRAEVRGVSRQLAALAPTLGPVGVIANLLGWGSGGGSAAAGGGAMAGGGGAAAGGGAATSAGLLAGGAGHVATLLAAAVVTAGGAVELQSTLAPPAAHRGHHLRVVADPPSTSPSPASPAPALRVTTPGAHVASVSTPDSDPKAPVSVARATAAVSAARVAALRAREVRRHPITEVLDPDLYLPPAATNPPASGSVPGASTPGSGTSGANTGPTTGTGASQGASTGTNGSSGTGSGSGSQAAAGGTPSATADGTGSRGGTTGLGPSNSASRT